MQRPYTIEQQQQQKICETKNKSVDISHAKTKPFDHPGTYPLELFGSLFIRFHHEKFIYIWKTNWWLLLMVGIMCVFVLAKQNTKSTTTKVIKYNVWPMGKIIFHNFIDFCIALRYVVLCCTVSTECDKKRSMCACPEQKRGICFCTQLYLSHDTSNYDTHNQNIWIPVAETSNHAYHHTRYIQVFIYRNGHHSSFNFDNK